MFTKRDPRTPVSVAARMRVENSWHDVTIRNVSRRGMMLSSEQPVRNGAYIEIRKQDLIFIGRSVWVRGSYFGVRTQDTIDLPTLLGRAAMPNVRPTREEDRRTAPRPEAIAARSRMLAARFQFALAVGAVTAAAGWIAVSVAGLLDRSFAPVRAALGG